MYAETITLQHYTHPTGKQTRNLLLLVLVSALIHSAVLYYAQWHRPPILSPSIPLQIRLQAPPVAETPPKLEQPMPRAIPRQPPPAQPVPEAAPPAQAQQMPDITPPVEAVTPPEITHQPSGIELYHRALEWMREEGRRALSQREPQMIDPSQKPHPIFEGQLRRGSSVPSMQAYQVEPGRQVMAFTLKNGSVVCTGMRERNDLDELDSGAWYILSSPC